MTISRRGSEQARERERETKTACSFIHWLSAVTGVNKPASLPDSIETDPGLVLTIMVGSCLHKWGVYPGEANASLGNLLEVV